MCTLLVTTVIFATANFTYSQERHKPLKPPPPVSPDRQSLSEEDREEEGEPIRQFLEEGHKLQEAVKKMSKDKKEFELDEELHEDIEEWLMIFRQKKESLPRLANKRPFLKELIQNVWGIGLFLETKDSQFHKEIAKLQKEREKLQRNEKAQLKEYELLEEDNLTDEEQIKIMAHKILEGHHCEECCDDHQCQEHNISIKPLDSRELEKWGKIATYYLNENSINSIMTVKQNENALGSEYTKIVRQILSKVDELTTFDNSKIKGLSKDRTFVEFFNLKIKELKDLKQDK